MGISLIAYESLFGFLTYKSLKKTPFGQQDQPQGAMLSIERLQNWKLSPIKFYQSKHIGAGGNEKESYGILTQYRFSKEGTGRTLNQNLSRDGCQTIDYSVNVLRNAS